jgi:hypothetical protein
MHSSRSTVATSRQAHQLSTPVVGLPSGPAAYLEGLAWSSPAQLKPGGCSVGAWRMAHDHRLGGHRLRAVWRIFCWCSSSERDGMCDSFPVASRVLMTEQRSM